MINNGYLIPANAKKSMLIFGLFNKLDLLIFGSGIGLTLILLLALPIEQLTFAIIALSPALITGFLVFPIPNYHNSLRFFISLYEFLTTRQRFIWKGWCSKDGEEEQK